LEKGVLLPSLVLQPSSISPSVMKKPMKLVDPYTGKMECQVCGSEHYASIKPRSNGAFIEAAGSVAIQTV